MSKRFVMVLAVLVAALGGYVVVFERGSVTSKQLEERKGKVLRSFVRDQVLRLSLTRAGVTLVLERQRESDGTLSLWKLSAPGPGRADQDAVDRLLGELEWLSPRRVLEQVSAKDREPLGLKVPQFRFSYRVDGVDYAAEVGGKDAQGENYYVALDGEDTVYVVPKTLVEALDYDVGHFRAKEFLGDITSAWAQKLTLQQAEQKLTLQKENERWWVLNEPKGLADEQRVTQIVAALDGLRAVRFVEDAGKAEAQSDLARVAQRVELDVIPDTHREDKAPQRFVLLLGGACKGHEGERYAQAGDKSDPVCVRAEDVAGLAADAAELRLMRLFGVDTSQIERIELQAGDAQAGTKWAFKREGEKWLGEGLPAAPDRLAVEAWLHDLSEARASEVVAALANPKGPRLLVTLASQQKLTLMADVGAADKVLVQREGEPVALRFDSALADLLQPLARRFVALELWPGLQPSQVSSIDARSDKLRRGMALTQGTWRVCANVKRCGPGADGAAMQEDARVRELVREVTKLSAVSIVSDRARPEYGFERSGVALSFTVEGGAPHQLELGADTERGAYARLDGVHTVIVAREVRQLVEELAGGERVVVAGEEAEGPESDEHEHEHEHAEERAQP